MNNYFPSPLQEFVFYDKYSRFRDDLGRRETWPETVERAVSFLRELSKNKLSEDVYDKIHSAILNLEAMPALRLLAMAGEAARRNNIAIFNCGYLNIDSIDSFVEIMVLSMNGCGLGYSVEKHNISKLPRVPVVLKDSPHVHIVPDTTEGWYESLRKHLNSLYNGDIIRFDYSQIRPSGTRLKVRGGQASGPEVLQEALESITRIFLNARGRQLSSVECSDIACWIGNAAVSGGSRRTAMLSLSDLDDDLMRNAKIGDFPRIRYNVNNSMVLDFGVTKELFYREMDTLFEGQTGERGIFNRGAAVINSPTRRIFFSKPGVNACAEIVLQTLPNGGGLCNLSSVICRANDTKETLLKKIEVAAIIGTIQATAEYFPGLRQGWVDIQRRERLLGVDLNGQMDCPILVEDKGKLREALTNWAIEVNSYYAEQLGIRPATAVTCVKPNGNSSQLLDCASGLHPRYSPFYIRRVQISERSPIFQVLKESGVKLVPYMGDKWVAEFPIKSPENSKFRKDFSAVQMCEFWLLNKVWYTEHNPSITIYYKEEEQEELKEWLWAHYDKLGGLAFFPYSDAKYDLQPYEEITEEEYESLPKPTIDWSLLPKYELYDQTTASQEIGCGGGACAWGE
jgi:ribonucleoside-diphosphate reductase alpha chain